ncbi:uncharacterized protein [Spinacia oleracea]|uniref:FHA domain-containing protein n=1 Tax=Spinacia oleracea TaxID=3562 RepID=A0ABM3QVU6_SPIOL|nr:uncharacterized protein LOC130462710 [Spinacia oleracea]
MRIYQKQSMGLETSTTPWLRLLSQYAQNQTLPISVPVFSVGSNRQCNLILRDQTASGILCRIKNTKREGCMIDVLESTGSKGSVFVNGMSVKKNTSRLLHSGDEHGADPNLGLQGEKPLIVALSSGNIQIIKCLLKAGADPNTTNFVILQL